MFYTRQNEKTWMISLKIILTRGLLCYSRQNWHKLKKKRRTESNDIKMESQVANEFVDGIDAPFEKKKMIKFYSLSMSDNDVT